MGVKPEWYFDDPVFRGIWEKVKPYTMTSVHRGYALYNATKFISESKVPGNIVESGVWRGGSSMLIAMTLYEMNDTTRDLYLFDTFSGMTEPQPIDVDVFGNTAKNQLEKEIESKQEAAIWAFAELEEVKENMSLTKYPADKIHFVKGDVRKTAQQSQTRALALLRLDTDWYASTKAELRNFYPRLNQNGMLILDDYGHWHGAKKAVDEFFISNEKAGYQPVYLQPVDYTGRVAIKPEKTKKIQWQDRYDYYPDSLNCPDLFHLFPYLQNTNTDTCRDKRLRREVPHIWRTDTREKPCRTGNVSTEEASVLYALAKAKSGKRAIEIGSHYGWSTAHLLEGGLTLDAIDPAFADNSRHAQVSTSLQQWIDTESVKLWPGYSPQIVHAISKTRLDKYALAFIDGNHDNEAPLLDVQAVVPYLEDDAFIVFHDLTFDAVAAAVRYLNTIGWNVRVYNTMQIMAVAWREGEEPVRYNGDPNHAVKIPPYLQDLDTQYGEINVSTAA